MVSSYCACLLTFIFHIITLYISVSTCNEYDPHLFPKQGPFFEGWYLRLIDFDTSNSIGLLFGQVLPIHITKDPLVLGSILVRMNVSERGSINYDTNTRLHSYDMDFNISKLNISVDGNPVSKNPDRTSPSNFSWYAESNNSYILFLNEKNRTAFCVKFECGSFIGELGSPVPWGSRGEGPEGWIDNLPLPLHWFVYSLHSPIKYYEFRDDHSRILMKGNNGAAHLEKNWGDSFPAAWIWAQGLSHKSGNVYFALSGGPVHLGPIDIYAHLFGYRNSEKGISLDFRPDNSVISVVHSGCEGYVNLTAKSLLHEIHLYIHSPISSFSRCLFGPENTGFRPVCKESYDAVSTISVYKRHISALYLIDKQTIFHSALEFGGLYVCLQICK